MEVLILLGLVLLNGVFAMSEIAVVTARKARLKAQADAGDRGALAALKLSEDPTQFLSAVQIGITSIGLLNGIVGEAVLAAPLAVWLEAQGVSHAAANIGSTAVVVVVVTYVSIVAGELVPKRLGQMSPEAISRLIARPMQVIALVTRPFVLLLSVSTHGLLRLMGVKQSTQSGVTEEEIHALLTEGSEAGVIEQHEHAIVRKVFQLDDRQLGSLMVPRSDIVSLDVQLPHEENLRRIIASEHSRFPVCNGGLDDVLGVIHAKQALAYYARGETPDYARNLQPAMYVTETATGLELLEQFRAGNGQMAFVIDEYGEIEGVVTLQDILEAVLGEFATESSEDASAIQRDDGSWLLDGAISILEVKDCLGIKTVPEEEKRRYHTLSGMIMLLLGKIPATGEKVAWESWSFEVVDMDQKRIDKVLASPILAPAADPDVPADDSATPPSGT